MKERNVRAQPKKNESRNMIGGGKKIAGWLGHYSYTLMVRLQPRRKGNELRRVQPESQTLIKKYQTLRMMKFLPASAVLLQVAISGSGVNYKLQEVAESAKVGPQNSIERG